MLIHDYDIETEPVVRLEAFYGPKKHLADKCLILFSQRHRLRPGLRLLL